MVIKNKLESMKKINELGLNRFPEQLFKAGKTDKVEKFLETYPEKYYAIRDKTKAGGTFKFSVAFDDVLKEIEGYSLFTISVSSDSYEANQLLTGEIQVTTTGEIYAILSVDPRASSRDATISPTFNIKTHMLDEKLNSIPCFYMIYHYIKSKFLEDVVVEFSIFDRPVGIKKEKIVVYEIRTDY